MALPRYFMPMVVASLLALLILSQLGSPMDPDLEFDDDDEVVVGKVGRFFQSKHLRLKSATQRKKKSSAQIYADEIERVKQFDGNSTLWIGTAENARHINNATWHMLVDMNCFHHVHVYIVAKKKARDGRKYFGHLRQLLYLNSRRFLSCGNYTIQSEEDLLADYTKFHKKDKDAVVTSESTENKAALVRDAIREMVVRTRFNGTAKPLKQQFVIVADMEIQRFPMATKLVTQIQHKLVENIDSLCSMEVTANDPLSEEVHYYDTRDTVFLPDTFAHPLNKRLFKDTYDGEDAKLIRTEPFQKLGFQSRGEHFTPYHMMNYLQELSTEDEVHHVSRVRSCFGGLVVYRADVYLTPKCHYQLNENEVVAPPENPEGRADAEDIYRYATDDRSISEHIVFHDCLHRERPAGFTIAIDPFLFTIWNATKSFNTFFNSKLLVEDMDFVPGLAKKDRNYKKHGKKKNGRKEHHTEKKEDVVDEKKKDDNKTETQDSP